MSHRLYGLRGFKSVKSEQSAANSNSLIFRIWIPIKVLPQNIADMAERKQRFERKAQTIAALNHPHICVVYDSHTPSEDFLCKALKRQIHRNQSLRL